ncbi:MAG: hypothetical protein HY815_13770 [Candidatus Riflebacteria bacterium]|nr:hypothetical protein [Candidatus Riflebacteria bacterium]
MRAAVSTMLLLGLSTFLDAAPPPPAGRATAVGAGFPAMEKFIINAQYRGVATKSFKNLGKGTVRYQHTGAGQFGLGIISSLSNPENGEKYRLNVEGRFRIRGRAIERIEQRLDLNEQARRYENLVTHNLPFVYIAGSPEGAHGQRDQQHRVQPGHRPLRRGDVRAWQGRVARVVDEPPRRRRPRPSESLFARFSPRGLGATAPLRGGRRDSTRRGSS